MCKERFTLQLTTREKKELFKLNDVIKIIQKTIILNENIQEMVFFFYYFKVNKLNQLCVCAILN